MVTERREEIPLPKLYEAVLPHQTTVYVTVFNIIQCIALAFWINDAKDIVIKKEFSFSYSLRSAVALAIILIIWHRNISEFQYLWPTSWPDTLTPFSIGIVECMIVFSMNPKTTSLDWFILNVMLFQVLTAISYGYTYYKRKMGVTEKLYKTFYSEYPQFVSHLTNLLKEYDLWHFKVFIVASITSVVLFVIMSLSPGWGEFVVPTFYLIGITQGEIVNNFQKALRKDKAIGPYFQ